MKLHEFNSLSENDKASAVVEGMFLADRAENNLFIHLFAIFDFYVERYYDPVTNKILRFRAFIDQEELTPYLAHIRFNIHR